ncbi:MAG: MBL fold metallo-hydrolase, partial [Lachnospiraceae bacterium]|nr:MBL fold metallo-hydrolase [Lachnospiraceae bacterium]
MVIKSFLVSPAETNCYLAHLEGNNHAICVDPGDQGEAIGRAIEKEGLVLEAILLTHGHFDHILGVDALRKMTGALVYAEEKEREICEDPVKNLTAKWLDDPFSLQVDKYVKDGEVLNIAGMEIQVLSTPGHTVGGCCYYVPKEEVCFTGDTVFQSSIGRSDLPTGDYDTLISSIHKKIAPLPENTSLLPGHGDYTKLALEKKHNPYFRGL